MADFEADAIQRKAVWDSFTKLMTYGSIACIVVIVFLGLVTL